MAVSLTTITGNVEFPTGTTPARASIRFRLTGPGANGGNVFLGQSAFVVQANGSFSAEVQHTESMDIRTYYEVSVSYFDGDTGRQVERALGLIKVPQSESAVTLASLLPTAIPSSASNVYRTKRGDTISFGIVMLDDHNRPLDLTGYSIAASMRQGDGPIRSFVVTRVSNPQGRFDLTLSAAVAAGLALGAHEFDIKFSTGGRVARTLTGTIIIEREVTP